MGEADLVVAQSVEGQLGILPAHAPLLALLDVGPLRVRSDKEELRAVIDGGFLHVRDDRVDVLAEHAEMESEIDVEAERARREELERRVREGDADARAELLKAMARLDLAEGPR